MSKILMGDIACALAAVDAGLKFYAGYPITPSSEIAEALSELLPKHKGIYLQMEDEIGSIMAAIGASYAGYPSMTATSGPGFSLMQEAIGYAAMAEIPVTIIDVMRAGPATGLATQIGEGDLMQAIWGTHGDHPVLVFSPGNVREFYIYTQKALFWAEKLRVPAVVLADEVIGHMKENVELPEPIKIPERRIPDVKPEQYLPYAAVDGDVVPLPPLGSGYLWHMTGSAHGEDGFPTIRPDRVKALLDRLISKTVKHHNELVEYEAYMLDDAEVLVVSFASMGRVSKGVVKELRDRGVKVGLLTPLTMWPFFAPELRAVVDKLNPKKIVVPEINYGQLRILVEWALRGTSVPVIGVNLVNGDLIPPEMIEEAILHG
ncbi:2-oxoacid:acceptor oxidoreductase subunit alpha [Coprothermobacteraceae bacterium]|nr:2-oxoacid:acceptor oxidoreductase subunit alpha [Coprothermobacteraceae bacterium]